MPKDEQRTRDFARYSDHDLNWLPWWKRWLQRLERVFEMNR